MRVYCVEIRYEVFVCAPDESEAEEEVQDNRREIVTSETPQITTLGPLEQVTADEGRQLPWGWRDEANPDRTAGERVALAKATPPADPRQGTLPGVSL